MVSPHFLNFIYTGKVFKQKVIGGPAFTDSCTYSASWDDFLWNQPRKEFRLRVTKHSKMGRAVNMHLNAFALKNWSGMSAFFIKDLLDWYVYLFII